VRETIGNELLDRAVDRYSELIESDPRYCPGDYNFKHLVLLTSMRLYYDYLHDHVKDIVRGKSLDSILDRLDSEYEDYRSGKLSKINTLVSNRDALVATSSEDYLTGTIVSLRAYISEEIREGRIRLSELQVQIDLANGLLTSMQAWITGNIITSAVRNCLQSDISKAISSLAVEIEKARKHIEWFSTESNPYGSSRDKELERLGNLISYAERDIKEAREVLDMKRVVITELYGFISDNHITNKELKAYFSSYIS
jgi:hypothetical protein